MDYEQITQNAQMLQEVNPMMGFRGCRLALVNPEITKMQIQAIINAALEVQDEGISTFPEIMIPLVVEVEEIIQIMKNIEDTIDEILKSKRRSLKYHLGTMMETPRACITAEEIAPTVEFMCFGTNDLTQMTYGFSRDDLSRFLPEYIKHRVIKCNPFVSIDKSGVGELMRMAVKGGSKQKNGSEFGICGEHGGDPISIQFFHDLGLDYVSCSPYRVPIARIAAAQASIRSKTK